MVEPVDPVICIPLQAGRVVKPLSVQVDGTVEDDVQTQKIGWFLHVQVITDRVDVDTIQIIADRHRFDQAAKRLRLDEIQLFNSENTFTSGNKEPVFRNNHISPRAREFFTFLNTLSRN